MSEINKQQIAEVKEAMAKAIRLCERLANSLRKKTALEGWEKKALIEHNDIISACNKSRFLLDCLPTVQVIELEVAPTELVPPSAPTSVDEPEEEEEEEQRYCLLCNKHLLDPCYLGNENGKAVFFCDPCYKVKKARDYKQLIDETDKLQDEKDRLSTELSLQKSSLRTKTLQIIKNLESVGYDNLDAGRKKRLTLAKKRIAEEDNFLD
jgi:Zn-finger protein